MLSKVEFDMFWTGVNRTSPDACWEWMRAKDKDGYGVVYDSNKKSPRQAHRMALELAIGPIPDGAQVLHDCDNRPCCNPGHLRFGSHADNMADMVTRKRLPRGLDNHRGKLSDEAKQDVLVRLRRGETQRAVAERHGIGQAHVSRIGLEAGLRRRTGPRWGVRP